MEAQIYQRAKEANKLYMDDWAILLRHDNPAALLHDIKALLDRVHQVTQECGHSLNFAKGKTA
eukprot:12782470-Prorocentrum_lima.AAC.1